MKFSRAYMKNEEFKAKQLWLPFEEALKDTLEVLLYISATAARTWKEWKKSFVTKAPEATKPQQRFLDFGLKILEMRRKAA